MSHTKIICTIGPRYLNPNDLTALRDAGLGIARLNGSHSNLAWHADAIQMLRRILPDVPILLDLPGKKVRTGDLVDDVQFSEGAELVFTTSDATSRGRKIPVNYAGLHEDVTSGDTILADDGTLRFKVSEVRDRDIICVAENGGTIRRAKGINLPGVKLRSKPVTDRDVELVEFGRDNGVEFLGISFVENAAHIEEVRRLIGSHSAQVVAKVETREGLDSLNEIVAAADAIMIDRGDLSAETDLVHVALNQKHIIAEANKSACPVIVATEMLHTMIDHATPTKAEVSDITNAVLDGASALMLSGETAIGDYPVQAVSTMREVASAATAFHSTYERREASANGGVPAAMGNAIESICRHLPINKIVAVTKSGYAARVVSAKRLSQQILAVTKDSEVARGFNLLYGTRGIAVDVEFARTSLDHIPKCLRVLWELGDIADDELIVVIAVGYPKSGNRLNLIETHLVSDLRETFAWDAAKHTATGSP